LVVNLHRLKYCKILNLKLFSTNRALGTNVYLYILGPVDLKKKYNAEWALVTGSGTGIGKSIAETMAMQGLNVVLVSLPDKFLDETTEQLQKTFPKQKFIKVPAVFDHKTDYMPAIIEVITFVEIHKLLLIR
jgi:predicted GTPase